MPLGFVLSPQVIVTVRYSEVHAFAQVEARVKKGLDVGSTTVFAALIDSMVAALGDGKFVSRLRSWHRSWSGLRHTRFQRVDQVRPFRDLNVLRKLFFSGVIIPADPIGNLSLIIALPALCAKSLVSAI